ncbi:putative ABC transport system permease protein [Granulicella aggregans]|uniref:Putative ABC transport system permease protein n=1 Tax=Granulicella aggregans TaxID=474949 RepID=A0A7W7ZBS5_9BACT|nr:FtsX-like permease family protein [Granulicella aggregans]MBB5056471.1 putative ABC transport system permease protein [Granulicella aggregans]
MNKLVFGNLVHRPLRSVISVFAVAIEVVMILSITAILMGKLNGFKDRTNGIGMDMFVRPPTTNNFVGLSSASASIKIGNVIAQVPHIKVVAPVNIQITGALDNIYGIDYATFNALAPYTFRSGGPFQEPYDIIVDEYAAAGKKVGDSITVLNHPFRICGIVEHGKGGRKFIPIETMGKLTGTEGKVTAFYLKTDDAPKYEDDVKTAIQGIDGLQGYSVLKTAEYLDMMTPARLPGFNIGLEVVIGIAAVIGFMVIFQSMYTAVMERTREIGILKSMGASKSYIVGIVMRETGLLAVTGIVVGVVGSFALSAILQNRFPTLDFVINLPYVWKAVVIAFAGALLGAFYPALKAASKDPIDALAYE